MRPASLLPRRFEGWFMKVRLVCTSKRRVPKNGIEADSTWAMSITSPVRISRVARSTVSGFMWLPDPRSSPAPHFEGQRWFSAGGRQDWAWEATLVEPTTTAMTLRTTTGLMGPPRGSVVVRAAFGRRRRAAPTLSQTFARRNEGATDPIPQPTSGDLDDARLDRLEPIGDQRIVARDDQPLGAGERVDRLEGREHLGQARDDLDGLARLHVAIEVRGVGGEHDRPASGLDRDDLEPRGGAADAVHADPGEHLAVAVDDPDPARIVQRHQPRQRSDVRRLPERRIVAVRPRPEGHLVPLDPVLRPGEQAVPGPVVVVEVGDERDGHVPRLHARALDHRRRAHVAADPALPRVVVEEPGVHEDRVRAAEDQPDVVVERDRLVRRLAVEELAGRRIPLPVLERVDFVHGSPRVGSPSSGSIVWQAVAAHPRSGRSRRLMSGRLAGKIAIVTGAGS